MRGLSIMMIVMALSTLLRAQIAVEKCKFLGNVISNFAPSSFNTYWNQVTPENAGKWGSVESVRDLMSWNGLDNAYDHAKTNDFPFRQHAFVWGQQQPGWIGSLSEEEQREEVEEWIQQFCERYPDTDFIDVVNEPLHEYPSYGNALGGAGTTGYDWIIWVFEKAREYCPNAKLFLNDYNVINNNSATDQYLVIINILKERGLIDGIGEQGHFLESSPVSTVKNNLDKLAAAGLPVQISEYDVNIANDTEQLAKYREQFPVLWDHPAVEGITLWGYIERQIWRPNAFLLRNNGTERPALPWLKQYVSSHHGGFFCYGPVLGVDSETIPRVVLYPNPAVDGKITIEWDEGIAGVKIRDMKDSLVKEIHTEGVTSLELTMDVSSGLYNVQILGRRGSVFRKLIIP